MLQRFSCDAAHLVLGTRIRIRNNRVLRPWFARLRITVYKVKGKKSLLCGPTFSKNKFFLQFNKTLQSNVEENKKKI